MKKILFTIVIISLMPVPSISNAATNILTGGVTLGANYDSNVGRTPDNEVDQWETTVNAFISLDSQAQKGALSFRYAPTLKYNHRTDENKLDHRLHFNAFRDLSERLRFNIRNLFIKTDDIWGEYLNSNATNLPDEQNESQESLETGQEPDPTLSDRIGRKEFWSNYFTTSLFYEYAKNSRFTVGYTNRVLEYDEPAQNNYLKHNPWVSVSYWFNHRWNTNFSYNYTDGEFDITEDVLIHQANWNINYVQSVADTIFAGLAIYDKEYVEGSGNIPIASSNYRAWRANLGWQHAFSPQKEFSITAGPSYVENDDQDDYWTTYFDIGLTSRFETGAWFIRANGGLDDRSFDGASVSENLSDYQRFSGGVNWQLKKNLSAGLSGYIRGDDFLENPFDNLEKTYNATANLRYSFARLYFVSARYLYTQKNDDLDIRDYIDHRFFITLGFSKELNRW